MNPERSRREYPVVAPICAADCSQNGGLTRRALPCRAIIARSGAI
jgi:hypothetical protein